MDHRTEEIDVEGADQQEEGEEETEEAAEHRRQQDHHHHHHHHHQQQQHHHHQQQIDAAVTTAGAHPHTHTYSIYEPHYQQMHPLIYYEEPLGVAGVPHNWATDGQESHYVHMPMMIPYGDTSTRACGYQTTTTPTTTEEPPEEPVVGRGAQTAIKSAAASSNSNKNNGGGGGRASRSSGRNKRERSGSPVPTNRELHNEIERRRRSRIKNCCEVLRGKIPGLSDKTDKATVLEHTVKFINHLVGCPEFKCNCETSKWDV